MPHGCPMVRPAVAPQLLRALCVAFGQRYGAQDSVDRLVYKTRFVGIRRFFW